MFGNVSNNIGFYKKALDGTAARHKAISSNLANVNTPKYKRKAVSFESQLKQELDGQKGLKLKETHNKHIGVGAREFNPITLRDRSGSYRFDGNNVNLDTESADLAKNTIMYNAIVKQISGEFEKIKNVVREGGK